MTSGNCRRIILVLICSVIYALSVSITFNVPFNCTRVVSFNVSVRLKEVFPGDNDTAPFTTKRCERYEVNPCIMNLTYDDSMERNLTDFGFVLEAQHNCTYDGQMLYPTFSPRNGSYWIVPAEEDKEYQMKTIFLERFDDLDEKTRGPNATATTPANNYTVTTVALNYTTTTTPYNSTATLSSNQTITE